MNRPTRKTPTLQSDGQYKLPHAWRGRLVLPEGKLLYTYMKQMQNTRMTPGFLEAKFPSRFMSCENSRATILLSMAAIVSVEDCA